MVHRHKIIRVVFSRPPNHDVGIRQTAFEEPVSARYTRAAQLHGNTIFGMESGGGYIFRPNDDVGLLLVQHFELISLGELLVVDRIQLVLITVQLKFNLMNDGAESVFQKLYL